jgi:hypothetical protein
MVRRIKLAGLIATLLVIFLPSFTLAQDVNFSVAPAEVKIDNLPPGEATEFELTIHNKDDVAHVFTFTTFQPPEEKRREGRAEFPDDSWISFSYPGIEVPANFAANVTVTVAIPQEQKWTGEDWETWLGVAAESSDLLGVKLYVRLLVSTNPVVEARSNAGLVAAVVVAIILLGYGGYYYYRRRNKPE